MVSAAPATVFQQEIDSERQRLLKPYRVAESTRTIGDIFAEINRNMFIQYGPDYRRGGPGKLVMELPQRYADLLDELRSVPGLRFMTCRDMIKVKPDPQEMLVNLRHDVDGDLRAALQQATIEARRGIVSTFYILHTSYYYGTFVEDEFRRNRAILHVCREIQDMGHEIALHTDPLHIYQNFGIDGAQALTTELEWLRGNGLNVTGSVAHNSAPVYGSNNFGIFKGRPALLFGEPDSRGVIHNGKWAPLQVLDERELGLEYEGDDVFWQYETRVEYACLMKHDGWYCESNKHGQRTSLGPKRGRVSGQWRSQDGLVDHIEAIEKGCYVVLSVHPEFYGLRHSETTGPTERLRRTSSIVNKAIGWDTCEPHATVAVFGDADGRMEFQSLAVADEFGMLHRPPPPAPLADDEIRIVFLGRDNLHAESLCVPAKIPARVEALFERQHKRKVRTWTMAAPGMGFGRSISWLRKLLADASPHFVVIGTGADEPECSDPAMWSAVTGYHPKHPPGEYIWNGISANTDPQWRLYASLPRAQRGCYSLTQANAGLPDQTAFMHLLNGLRASLDQNLQLVRSAGARPILLVEECGEHSGLWRDEVLAAEREAAHRIFRSYLKSIVTDDSVPVVDIYSALPAKPIHWRSRPEWNLRGQQLAAESIAAAIHRCIT